MSAGSAAVGEAVVGGAAVGGVVVGGAVVGGAVVGGAVVGGAVVGEAVVGAAVVGGAVVGGMTTGGGTITTGGGGGRLTLIVTVAVLVCPSAWVIVSVTEYVPGAAKVCVTLPGGPTPDTSGVPSPKLKFDETNDEPIPAVLVDPSRVTLSGAVPDAGLAVNLAVGPGDPTVTVADADADWPSLCVTVNVAVNDPGTP